MIYHRRIQKKYFLSVLREMEGGVMRNAFTKKNYFLSVLREMEGGVIRKSWWKQ
jgi:hypothetical protein